MSSIIKYPRGSEWRQWDLHIHTPASFHWDGPKFTADVRDPANNPLIDEMIATMNAAKPAVFALMDYWTFDGWFALRRRLQDADAPKLHKTVFPGIELRLNAPMKGRLNAHVIFSDQISDQQLKDFLSHTELEFVERQISPEALREYARRLSAEKLKAHGINKDDITSDDIKALDAGSKTAELKVESYKKAIQQVPDGMALGYMPFNTNDGLTRVSRNEHHAYALTLFESSPIFEARDDATWNAFVGRKTAENAEWIEAFQEALNHVPRLPVSGSDAHRFVGKPDDNNARGYGDFPSGRITWIKADPTWRGLLQALREPEKRAFIGSTPPKLEKVNQNKPFYINSVRVEKVTGSTTPHKWLDGCSLPLSSDLVAIIGNKGSGKSALADIIALAGFSKQTKHFSFLKKDRFRGKSGEPARNFRAKIEWMAGDAGEMVLSEDPAPEKVEMVKYIPQGHFEALCNDHVAGRGADDAFERELRAVIFDHTSSSLRDDAHDFDQLIEQQESVFRARLGELRRLLGTINEKISAIEDQLNPEIKNNLQQQLALKTKQLEELRAVKPTDVEKPTDQLTDDQLNASVRLAEIDAEISAKSALIAVHTERQATLATDKRAMNSIRDRYDLLLGQVRQMRTDTLTEFERLKISFDDVITFKADFKKLDEASAAAEVETAGLIVAVSGLVEQMATLNSEKAKLTAKLNEPQKKYQDYLANVSKWQTLVDATVGNANSPESQKGIEARLQQLDILPVTLDQLRIERTETCGKIFDVLSAQRQQRADMYSPVQQLIQANELIRVNYKLEFQAILHASHEAISENLFSRIKQSIGELRGDDESREAIKSRYEKFDLNQKDGALGFISEIIQLIEEAARKNDAGGIGIRSMLRKDRTVIETYDYIFGLEYLEPKYTLLFQDTQIEQLSPGQRGALLLIFYLLVDKGRNPIILDQPEENLDNETVVNLLVPVINDAKQNRQIIMVTHNPNLAVVCDAEQIIHATFDRTASCTISYESGSIEDRGLNHFVVTVLEGTKRPSTIEVENTIRPPTVIGLMPTQENINKTTYGSRLRDSVRRLNPVPDGLVTKPFP